MSFWSTLSKVFTVVSKAAPVVSLINPAAGAILGAIINAIVAVEPQAMSGAEKKVTVTGVANAVAAAHGFAINPTQLSALIDGLVGALNKLPEPVVTVVT